MATLGIGQLTAIEVNPLEYVSIAAEAGLDFLSLFVCQASPQSKFPLTTRENFAAVKERLGARGLKVSNIECFVLTPTTDVEAFRPLLEMGAELGARSATTLLYDADNGRVIHNLSRISELAGETSLRVGVEFMPLAPGWKNFRQTADLVNQVAKPNLGITIDLLHLIRSGGTPAEVAAADPRLIANAQLCDSKDLSANETYFEEASVKRLAPGEGNFPVQEFLRALPEGTPLEIEVPRPSDIPALERVKDIVKKTRRQIELAGI